MINVVDAVPNAPLLHPIGFVQVQVLPHITTVPPPIFGAIPWLKTPHTYTIDSNTSPKKPLTKIRTSRPLKHYRQSDAASDLDPEHRPA